MAKIFNFGPLEKKNEYKNFLVEFDNSRNCYEILKARALRAFIKKFKWTCTDSAKVLSHFLAMITKAKINQLHITIECP